MRWWQEDPVLLEGPWGMRPTIGPGGHHYAKWLPEPISASRYVNCKPPTRIVTYTQSFAIPAPELYPRFDFYWPKERRSVERNVAEKKDDDPSYEAWRANNLSATSLDLLSASAK